MLNETVNEFMRGIINLVTGEAEYAIRSHQDAPRPKGNYATVHITLDDQLGWEETIMSDHELGLDIDFEKQSMRNITASLQFFREGAYDTASKVKAALARESIQTLFNVAGLGLITRSDVRSIPEPLSSGWEDRAQLDVVLNAVGSDTEVVRSIQSVDIGAEYHARGLVYNLNIEVQ